MLALWTFVLYPDINNEQIGDIQIGLFCNHIWVKGCKNKIIQYTKRSLNIQSWGTGISNFVQIWSEKEVSSRTIKLRRKDQQWFVSWDRADYSSETMILNSFDKLYEFIFRITQVTSVKFRFVVYLRHILFCPRNHLVFRCHCACHRHQHCHHLRHRPFSLCPESWWQCCGRGRWRAGGWEADKGGFNVPRCSLRKKKLLERVFSF